MPNFVLSHAIAEPNFEPLSPVIILVAKPVKAPSSVVRPSATWRAAIRAAAIVAGLLVAIAVITLLSPVLSIVLSALIGSNIANA